MNFFQGCFTVQRLSVFGVLWSVFSGIWTEYQDLLRKSSPYSVRMRENTDKKTPNMDTSHVFLSWKFFLNILEEPQTTTLRCFLLKIGWKNEKPQVNVKWNLLLVLIKKKFDWFFKSFYVTCLKHPWLLQGTTQRDHRQEIGEWTR